MKSKFKIHDKVMVTSTALYPNEHHLMGLVTRIVNDGEELEKKYDIHYGITGIDDLKNIPESDIIFFA